MIAAVKLLAVFLVIVLVLKVSKMLPAAIGAGILSATLLFQLGAARSATLMAGALVSRMTIETLLAFYTIMFLQRMLEARGHLLQAQRSLGGLFNNRRVNASLAPMLIGMLPSAAAVTICGAIVDDAAGDSLTVPEKTFVTSYFRHIPESVLPTYTSVIIGVQLSGVPLPSFLLGTFPLVLVLIVLGYVFYLRKIPRETGEPPSENRRADAVRLLRSLWPLLLTILMVILLPVPVYIAVLASIALCLIFDCFQWRELRPIFRTAFEVKLLLSTALIMIFKDIIIETGAMNELPGVFSLLPLPQFLIYFLLFFFGTLLAGNQAINVIGLPLAFATVPGAGMPLLVLLMSCGYAAMQMSPTHICLAVVTEYFGVSFGELIKKTLPVILSFCVVLIGYYLLLNLL